MRIAIDVSPLKSGHKLRGIGSYTQQLIWALKRYETQHSYYLFTRGQNIPKNTDLVHYPYFEPFFLTLPFVKTKPTVVTVHDLIPIAYPSHFPRGIRGELRWQIQKMSLQNVKLIITDSIASKQDIVRLIGFREEKIHVIYLAPASAHPKGKDKKPELLQGKYILYVGDVNWNKNIPGLLHAYSLVRRKIPGIKLVLVGKQFLNSSLTETRDIEELIHELRLEKDVIKLGFVRDLRPIYRLASVYVHPSFAEGFGLPVLEAMTCGCPVVCANVSSLREILGPSIAVNPDADSISRGIFRVLTMSKAEREILVSKGIAWTKHFTWEKVILETVSVYEKALE